jgi:hypothetical protein
VVERERDVLVIRFKHAFHSLSITHVHTNLIVYL